MAEEGTPQDPQEAAPGHTAPKPRHIPPGLADVPPEKMCGAKTRGGSQCRNICVTGRNRCRMHGGKTPQGLAHPGWKGGARNSLKLPRGLAESYARAASDPELLSLRSGVALVEARLGQLVQQLDGAAPREMWAEMQGQVAELRRARAAQDGAGLIAAVNRIEALVMAGGEQARLWDDVFECLARKKELAQAEWKRLVDMRQIITEERAFLMVAAITEAVLRHVKEPQARNAIGLEIHRLVQSHGQTPHGNSEEAVRRLDAAELDDAPDGLPCGLVMGEPDGAPPQ